METGTDLRTADRDTLIALIIRQQALIETLEKQVAQVKGLRRFSLRGLTQVAAEWTTMVTAFNLRTLWRVWKIQQPAH